MQYEEKNPELERIESDRKGSTDLALAEAHRNIDHGFDPALVKRVTRKVDMRLIPVLSALYCISLIDRTNLSQAREANHRQMDKDLGFGTGNGYSLATLMFFVPYVSSVLCSKQAGNFLFGLPQFTWCRLETRCVHY